MTNLKSPFFIPMRFDPCEIPDSPFNSLEDTSAAAGLSKLDYTASL